MLNINLTSRSSSTVNGLLIFFVPFFTYLSPENLKQLSGSNVLEIFLSLPKTNVNTMRFALNCAYGFKLPYRKNVHYQGYGEESPDFGAVVERKIYE